MGLRSRKLRQSATAKLHAAVVDDLFQLLHGAETIDAELTVGPVPAANPKIAQVLSLHLDLWNHEVRTGRKDVVFQPSNLPHSGNHAKRWLAGGRRFEAGKAAEMLNLLSFDELIVVRFRGWPLNAD